MQGSLTRHILSVHEGVKYDCNQCDFRATRRGILTCHIQSVHEGVKYECNQCALMYCTTDVIAGESKQY